MVRHRLQHEPLPRVSARVHLLRHAQCLLRDRGHRAGRLQGQRARTAARRVARPAETPRHDRHGVDERPLHARRTGVAADPPGASHHRRRAFPGARHHQGQLGRTRRRHLAADSKNLRGGEFHRHLRRRRPRRPNGTRGAGLFGAVSRAGSAGAQGHLHRYHDDAAAAVYQ